MNLTNNVAPMRTKASLILQQKWFLALKNYSKYSTSALQDTRKMYIFLVEVEISFLLLQECPPQGSLLKWSEVVRFGYHSVFVLAFELRVSLDPVIKL